MNIVLEGPDGSGKSTLGNTLSKLLNMPLISGKGPPKSEREFEDRCKRYLEYSGVIFDRHPCISELIYSEIGERQCQLPQSLAKQFWATKPFVVYVRPLNRHLSDTHQCKAHETQEHVDMVRANHRRICAMYDARMLEIANYVYRRSDGHLQSLLRCASQFATVDVQASPSLFPTAVDFVHSPFFLPHGRRWHNWESNSQKADVEFMDLGEAFTELELIKEGVENA